ncbi:DUF1295-domain-containing protein [Punctularia strigosozonata HHB-11173 SS5]|uniref:DUF1295-domain-containing protein n=1 Tax=Punctularia strigosozonata (strain HHB-11173) TaxID=741275 RepID=UPI00044186B4|nr:DUF1295-domain-containing protein [Punctularia strigosozonata HHB-11173 SS5]EIN11908.1 DUF1295-domain-containing protein [Punctularia strigosozonata HHB-11173 SS5]
MSSPYLATTPQNPGRISIRALQRPVGTSFLVHTGLSVGTWLIGASTDRADVKDILWPTGMVADAWYQAIGIPVLRYGLPLSIALKGLTYRQALLLGGVTLWGLRLAYRITSRAVKQGHDDFRYTKSKLQPSFWLESLFKQFIPEALFQTIICLPFTAPFRATNVALIPWGWTDIAAVGLFTSGLTLETIADAQLATAKKNGESGLVRSGVWSIVRHPNYLADALTHLSFALLAANTTSFHPVIFLGPLANYIFLRFVGGDKDTEAFQEERYSQFNPKKDAQLSEYRASKNSFWPSPKEVGNLWTWAVLGAGAIGVAAEKILRSTMKPGIL